MKICKLVFTLFVFLLFSVSYGEVVEIVGFGFFRPHETKKVGSNIYTRGGYTFTYQRPDNIFFGQVVALKGRFNGKKGLTTWPGKEQGYYWAGSSYKSMNHPISTNLQVRYPAVDLCLLDAVWADELTVNKVGDDYHATYKIFIRKLQKVCNDPEKTSEWVDGQTIATGSGVHPDSEVAKCLARKNAITTSLQNGLTVHDVVSDNPCGGCDNQSMDVYIPPMAMIESCEPCDLAKNTTSNSGDVFQNGFSSCLSCSGGSMTLGGHYHVNFATVNSNMGYGWKNDFDIRVGKIMALDGSETYVFTQGGNRKFFARDVASGGFLSSSTDSQIDIVEDTSGAKTLNIKLGNNLYEFDVPTANGVLGEKTVKRSTQIMYEDFDDLGFFSYKGYSVTYTYDVNNRLSKIENEIG
ncbi:MAG: hypothetical protein PHT81_07255, partial [Endomicrobiaceae bacterium]|nr:hypothetical protein [Endomicrobiaceae bacterium]